MTFHSSATGIFQIKSYGDSVIQKAVFYKSSAAACALFVRGNAVMVFPTKTADEYTFLGFLVSAVCGIGLCIAFIPIADALIRENSGGVFIKIVKALVFLILAVAALHTAADAFSDFSDFSSEVILPDTAKAVITAVFGFAVIFFALKRQEDTLKFALIGFVFTAVAAVFFFFAMSENYNVSNIYISRLPDFGEFKNAVKPYFIKVTLPALLLPFYRGLVFGNKRSTACFTGTAIGYILLGLCILSPVMLFGTQLAGKLSYPYASAVSTVSVGKLFTRMDGFSYFIYFIAAITKINICIFIAVSALKKIRNLMNKKATAYGSYSKGQYNKT